MLIKSAGGIALGGVKRLGTGIFNMGRQAVTAATTAMAPLITSVWGFTAALLANPVTWVVIAMIALIAVLVLLYNKCEWFRDGVNAVWDSILSGGRAVVDFFGGSLALWFRDQRCFGSSRSYRKRKAWKYAGRI